MQLCFCPVYRPLYQSCDDSQVGGVVCKATWSAEVSDKHAGGFFVHGFVTMVS